MAFEATDLEQTFGFNPRWYDAKIKKKEEDVKDMIRSLSFNLSHCYEGYKNWLNRQSDKGIVLCQLVDPFRVDVEKPHGNLWKFNCVQQDVQQTDEELPDDEPKSTWTCIPATNSGGNIRNPVEFPHFVIQIVEVFQGFMRNNDEVKESFQNYTGKNEIWTELSIIGNDQDQYLLLPAGMNVSSRRQTILRGKFEENPRIKSIYLKNAEKSKYNSVSAVKIWVQPGQHSIYQDINGITFEINPQMNIGTSMSSLKRRFSAVKSFLTMDKETTAFGCGIGLVNLLLAKECYKVVSIDKHSEINKTNSLAGYNDLRNLTISNGAAKGVIEESMHVLKSSKKSVAIVDLNSHVLSFDIRLLTEQLRDVSTLDQVLIMSNVDTVKLKKKVIQNLVVLADPAAQTDYCRENPLFPCKAGIVDVNPYADNYLFLLLLERRRHSEIINVSVYSDDDEEETSEVEITEEFGNVGDIQVDCKLEDRATNCTSEGDVDVLIDELFEDVKVNNQIILPKPPPAIDPKPEKLHNKDYYDDRIYDQGLMPKVKLEREWYNSYKVKDEFKRERYDDYYSPPIKRKYKKEKKHHRRYRSRDRRRRRSYNEPIPPSEKERDELIEKLFGSKSSSKGAAVVDLTSEEQQPSTSAIRNKSPESHRSRRRSPSRENKPYRSRSRDYRYEKKKDRSKYRDDYSDEDDVVKIPFLPPVQCSIPAGLQPG